MPWIDSQISRSGEAVPARKMAWRLANQKRLKSAFPKAEQRFCRVVDTLRFHLPEKVKSLIWYKRQKLFSINSEICFFVDFYFKTWNLCVEIDGDSHSGELAKEMDAWREKLISVNGLRFLRLHNNFVDTADWWEIEDKFLDCIFNSPRHGGMKRKLADAIANLPERGRP
jgi:very-short-patch-repair endonuclease